MSVRTFRAMLARLLGIFLAGSLLGAPEETDPRNVLLRALAQERDFVRVHAAEALIAIGESALVRETYDFSVILTDEHGQGIVQPPARQTDAGVMVSVAARTPNGDGLGHAGTADLSVDGLRVAFARAHAMAAAGAGLASNGRPMG